MSASSLSALRAATVRSVWSSKMPLANTPFVLNLLDGPVGVDRAFHVIWTRFRMMREYLAHWPDEVARIFRMLDLIAHGADGHGLLRKLGLLGIERGVPLRKLSGPIQHSQSIFFEAWQHSFLRTFTTTYPYPPEGKR